MEAGLSQENRKQPPSPLKAKLSSDLKQALRSGDKSRTGTIRLVISAIGYAEIARHAELTDADIIGVIAKEIRQHRESIEAFQKGNRADLVSQEEAELAVLQEYMPQQLAREQIKAEVQKIITEVGAHGLADKGKVMSRLMPQLKGRADGREINEVVTEILSST